MVGGIYQIRNTVSGRKYVGSTCNFIQRKCAHFTQLRDNAHGNQQLQRAYDKYGKNALVFEILEELPREELIKVEQGYIDDNMGGYNIAKIAGSNAGVERTPEWLDKMSKSQKGRPKSDETKARMSAAKKGKTSNSKGKRRSKTSRARMSAAQTKKVYCIEMDKEYISRHEAAKDTGVSKRSISRSLNSNVTLKTFNLTFTYKVL